MTDRFTQARAEAEQQIHVYGDDFKARTLQANLNDAFVQGVEWADENPQPHTITRGGYEHAKRMFGISPAETRQFLRALGIEVEDNDE